MVPGNVTCGTRSSSLGMDGFVVCVAQSKEELFHHLPKPEFQVTLSISYENPCPGVGCAGDVSGEEQTLLTRLGHSSFSCSLGLCCASYMCTGNSLSALLQQEENLPIPSVYSLCA